MKGLIPQRYRPQLRLKFHDRTLPAEKMEAAGILYSQLRGKVRLYGLDPRYPFRKELESLLKKAFDFLSQDDKDKYYIRRRRPRQSGKPGFGLRPGLWGRPLFEIPITIL
jgi:hypothetical protein